MSITKISPSVVDFDDGITISTTDNSDNLTLTSTDTDANTGPVLNLNRAVTGADDDLLGGITFAGQDDANNAVDYAVMQVHLKDASDGAEDGLIDFQVMSAGTSRSFLILNGGGTVIVNQDSQDIDFRVESNDSVNMLFVDGGDNKVLIEAQNTDTVSNAATMTAAAVLEINGNAGEGSDHIKIGAMADGTGNQFIEATNSGATAAYKLMINPVNGGNLYSGGNLEFPSGKGIDFSATSNSAAVTNSELFDDYEEGTWTPGISTTGNSFASGAAVGRYIKIGKQVIATMLINNNSSNTFGSGQFIVTGFPYTCVNANAQVANMAPMIRYVTPPSNTFQLTNYMGANETQTYFYWSSSSNWEILVGDHVNNDTSFAMYAGFVYEATA
tara:strand:+ start:1143 stop:2300 length:1158 start_codon:yes stop_codon:yes gene_type:complete